MASQLNDSIGDRMLENHSYSAIQQPIKESIKIKQNQSIEKFGHDTYLLDGVGQKTWNALYSKGIHCIEQLMDKYIQLNCNQQEFEKYLQEQLGVQMTYRRVWESVHKLASPVNICIEGNISSGKSTLLQYFVHNFQDIVSLLMEPIHKWQNIPTKEGGNENILDSFYKDPKRYGYTFQNYVFLTRLLQYLEASSTLPYLIMERSILADRLVFMEAMQSDNLVDNLELSLYDSWYFEMVKLHPQILPDAYVYLKVSPDTCYQRLRKRNRMEESTVGLEYLRKLDENLERWFTFAEKYNPNQNFNDVSHSLDSTPEAQAKDSQNQGAFNESQQIIQNQTIQDQKKLNKFDEKYSLSKGEKDTKHEFNVWQALQHAKIPKNLEDKVYRLKVNLGTWLQKDVMIDVPVLILDYEENVDISRDGTQNGQNQAFNNSIEDIKSYFAWVHQFKSRLRYIDFKNEKKSTPIFKRLEKQVKELEQSNQNDGQVDSENFIREQVERYYSLLNY